MKHIRKFLLNALLLCGVSLLMRTVSVSFNVYVSNLAGAEAMGLYALLSGIYGFALTFATSGINISTVRLVTEALGQADHARARMALRKCVGYSLFFSGIATAALFFGADFIATRLLRDARALLSLRFLAFTLIPIALSSVFSGYFTAVRRVWKNATVQVIEQGIRIFAISSLLTVFLPRGVSFACAALALGGAIAECSSFLISLVAFLQDKRKAVRPTAAAVNAKAVQKALLGIALPIAFSAYARSGLVSLEHMLIPVGLGKSGLDQASALAAYGLVYSMALPIVLFPSALISSFSGLLIPELTECEAKKNTRQIRYVCERVSHLALLFSIGAAGIMTCFSGELGQILYPNTDAARYIRLLAPLIPVMYIDTTVDAMLKGLGEQVYCMKVNICDALLSVLLVFFLLPHMGIMGCVVTIYVTEFFNASLSVVRLIRKSGMLLHPVKWICKPLLCAMGSTCMARLIFTFCPLTSLAGGWRLTLHITTTAILYLLLSMATYGIDGDDVAWIRSIFAPQKPLSDR